MIEGTPQLSGEELAGKPFQKGFDPRRNTEGRPKGSLSVIGKLKQIWEEQPEDFESFVEEYRRDPLSRRHIAEMIDGKPRQNIGLDGGEDGKAIKIDITKMLDKAYGDIGEMHTDS